MDKCYSQNAILDAFKQGVVPGEGGVPVHIETAISNVFVFEKLVYKIYKNNNNFFNHSFRDISFKDRRFQFSRDDFEWNKVLARDVYIDLRGCKFVDDQLHFVDSVDVADELVIVMNNINTKNVLLLRLLRGDVENSGFCDIGKQLAMIFEKLPIIDTQDTLRRRMENRFADVKSWIGSVDAHISHAEVQGLSDLLQSKYHDYKKSVVIDGLPETTADVHAENLVYENDTVYLIDSYMPKEEWLLSDQSLNFYRPATDVLALRGRESFEEMKRGYVERTKKDLNQAGEDFYILYSAMIMVPYLYMLGERDAERMRAAQVYHGFLQKLVR